MCLVIINTIKNQSSKKEAISNDIYTLSIEAGNTIEIQETQCFECSTRFKKNGFNDRVAILDDGLGRHEFHLHRKYCRKCDEITWKSGANTLQFFKK